jgi:hypothetical protein
MRPYQGTGGLCRTEGVGRQEGPQANYPTQPSFRAGIYGSEKARKVEGMRELAIKHIDNLKPYKSGNQLLWRIHELDNIDKHRTLFTVDRDYLFVAGCMPTSNWPYWLKTDSPHFTGVFDPDVEKDVQLEIEKAVSRAKVTESDALLPSLQDLIGSTEELVFRFKPMLE